jgi:hypothetical protein
VNVRCPFRILKLYGDKLLDLLKLHNYPRMLKFARELHWLPSRDALARARSDGRFSLARLSIQYVLLKLSHPSSIRALYLHRIEIGPHHQSLILSIPSLRHLTLQQSAFIPGDVSMSHPLIESLSFGTGTVSPEAATHILQLLANSLKTLDVGGASEVLYPLMNTLRFAVLKCLRQRPTSYLHHFNSLSPHTSITELYLGSSTSQRWVIPVDYFQSLQLLPHLQRLSSPWRVAVRIIPGRPVKVFRDTELMGCDETMLSVRLCKLAESTAEQGMEEIRICHNTGVIGLLYALTMHMPHLKRLEISVWDHHPLQGENWTLDSNSSITEIEIRFFRPTRESLSWDVRAYPDQPCRTLFTRLVEECPKLEQVTFIAVNRSTVYGGDVFDEDEQDVPSDCKLKFCKTSKGTWEERLWGTGDGGNIVVIL